jgi:hypothetical protein
MSREIVSEHGLTVRVQHRRNPYDHLYSADEFDGLLLDLGLRRAASIVRNHAADPAVAPRGAYGRTAMGFVIMDPTVGPWVPNASAVLGVVGIGPDSERFLPNAAAKAGGHRRLGRNYGEAVLVDPHLCGRAAFRYGHSAQVRGVIVGASSQTPDQDLFEAGQLAADFVNAIAERQARWEEKTGPTDWLAGDNRPDQEYRDMVAFFEAG